MSLASNPNPLDLARADVIIAPAIKSGGFFTFEWPAIRRPDHSLARLPIYPEK
jgi:hypothetical protein